MSTVSKIFVVLTLLLSIGYCVAAAFLFAYSHDYRIKYEDEKAAHEESRKQKDREIANLKSKVEGHEKQIDALEAEGEKLKRDNDELKNDLDEKQRLYDDLDRANKTLNETHETLMRMADDLKNHLKEEQENVTALKDKLAEAEEKNNALTNELAVLKDDKNKIEKKLLATRKEFHKNEETLKGYEDILAKLEASGINVRVIPVTAEPVHGRVLAVDSETDIVVISVGANAHVTKGMKLSVYREDKFVGSISIISVFPDMSSARILREETQREVQPGDNVTNQF